MGLSKDAADNLQEFFCKKCAEKSKHKAAPHVEKKVESGENKSEEVVFKAEDNHNSGEEENKDEEQIQPLQQIEETGEEKKEDNIENDKSGIEE
jgi:hypothetical protein